MISLKLSHTLRAWNRSTEPKPDRNKNVQESEGADVPLALIAGNEEIAPSDMLN